ncbi:MAG TPA: NAD-dependent epimerase/dehydratase family protein [Planctomycetota bacterium]|nr:NAD-dependent epimerase/dehydratase family protein [Planctomycetota bacterium]
MPAVYMTGATGFVGGELARRLIARGHPVHALARADADRSALADLDVVWHEGDLLDRAALERGLAAAGAGAWVAHVAAVISYRTRDAELQQRVNVEGTRRLLDACRRADVARVLHMSSVVAVADSPDRRELHEDAAFNGARLGVDYVDTKRAAEELVLAARDLDVVVVNPGAIFGPNARGGNTVRFLGRLARGRIGPLAPPGTLAVVGVGDVAEGTILALERGERGRRYLLVESSHPTLRVFGLAARLLGVRGPRAAAPRPRWELAIGAVRAVDRVRATDLVTPQTLRMLGVHYVLSGERARRELGWTPTAFEDVLRATIEELRVAGRL